MTKKQKALLLTVLKNGYKEWVTDRILTSEKLKRLTVREMAFDLADRYNILEDELPNCCAYTVVGNFYERYPIELNVAIAVFLVDTPLVFTLTEEQYSIRLLESLKKYGIEPIHKVKSRYGNYKIWMFLID